jgi:hypothetical protein
MSKNYVRSWKCNYLLNSSTTTFSLSNLPGLLYRCLFSDLDLQFIGCCYFTCQWERKLVQGCVYCMWFVACLLSFKLAITFMKVSTFLLNWQSCSAKKQWKSWNRSANIFNYLKKTRNWSLALADLSEGKTGPWPALQMREKNNYTYASM